MQRPARSETASASNVLDGNLYHQIAALRNIAREWTDKRDQMLAETHTDQAQRIPIDTSYAEELMETADPYFHSLAAGAEQLEHLVEDLAVWLDEQTIPVKTAPDSEALIFGYGAGGHVQPIAIGPNEAKQVHVEHELRYLAPDDFLAPKSLGKFKQVDKTYHHQKNEYFDARIPAYPKGILYSQGCSFRVRETHQGCTATFKIKPPDCGKAEYTKRLEIEADIQGGRVETAEAPYQAVQRMIAGHELTSQFCINTFRVAYLYEDADGHQVELAHDHVTYPDGSQEARVEVELIKGEARLLRRAQRNLLKEFALQPAPRGKKGEARKRLDRARNA